MRDITGFSLQQTCLGLELTLVRILEEGSEIAVQVARL